MLALIAVIAIPAVLFAAGVAVGAHNSGRVAAIEARLVALEAKVKAKI